MNIIFLKRIFNEDIIFNCWLKSIIKNKIKKIIKYIKNLKNSYFFINYFKYQKKV